MDVEYYILDSGKKEGPFTAQELMDRPLEPDDLIILPLQSQGAEAYTLPEFADYFISEGIYYPTPENTASFWLRLPAFIIDTIIVVFTTELLAFIFFPGFMARITSIFNIAFLTDPKVQENLLKYRTEMMIIQAAIFVMTILYHSLCESTRFRGSIGKYILGLAVVDNLGYALTFGHALLRNLGKILYDVMSLVIGPFAFLAYMKILWSFRHQGIHDQMSNCFIVKRAK
ncbi:RDD family protein [Mucilaginibacter sp. HMF5004]|uniref:RDD family protein n=1 Tax=Mucilaginibacter rivuli TaxID=2857527 RepID=UPI001C604567|nr:RDD family protein [Mucilaginibacter rivuli]MBW4890981.1 RDD family protein [Mucilaginibacter rivuli]